MMAETWQFWTLLPCYDGISEAVARETGLFAFYGCRSRSTWPEGKTWHNARGGSRHDIQRPGRWAVAVCRGAMEAIRFLQELGFGGVE